MAIPFVIGLIFLGLPGVYLEVRNSRNGESYFLRRSRRGTRVTLSWVHSVERSPWVEHYEVVNHRFALREVNVKSFGSGVDPVAPVTRTSDGWVTMSEMQRDFPSLRFIHSPAVNRRLVIDGDELDLAERIPPYSPVEVCVRSAPKFLTWMIKA